MLGKLSNIYIDGEKTYDKDGAISSECCIGYKLYKNGSVIESGTIYSPAVSINESFINAEAEGFLSSAGNYTLELLSVQ